MQLKAILERFQFGHFAKGLREASQRFPLAVLSALVLTGYNIYNTHYVRFNPYTDTIRIDLFLYYALAFFTAARLLAEGCKLTPAFEWALYAVGSALIGALFFLPPFLDYTQVFIGAALALSLLFAPYICRRVSEDSFWYFNYLNGTGLVVAVCSGVVLGLGLSAVVGSMDYLIFESQFNKRVYGDIWIFCTCFFGPVMVLHQISRQFDFEKNECEIPSRIYFQANYLFVPLVLAYAWVLYVYFLKILLAMQLPKGSLAYLVSGFGSAGMAVRLAVFPMRETGTRLLQQFYKYFYHLMAVPMILLAIGLHERIGQYGVTEERYFVGILLVWLSLLTMFALVKPRRIHIKHPPMLLALLFVLAAVGPWSAINVSNASQKARLEALLTEAGVFVNGKVSPTTQAVPFEARKKISGILDYFYAAHRSAAVDDFVDPVRRLVVKRCFKEGFVAVPPVPRVPHSIPCTEGNITAMQVMSAWGMDYVTRWATDANEGKPVYINAPSSHVVSADKSVLVSMERLDSYDYFTEVKGVYLARRPEWTQRYVLEGSRTKPRIVNIKVSERGILTVECLDRLVTFDLAKLVKDLEAANMLVVPQDQSRRLYLNAAQGSLKVQIRVGYLNGRIKDGIFKLEGAAFNVLLTP